MGMVKPILSGAAVGIRGFKTGKGSSTFPNTSKHPTWGSLLTSAGHTGWSQLKTRPALCSTLAQGSRPPGSVVLTSALNKHDVDCSFIVQLPLPEEKRAEVSPAVCSHSRGLVTQVAPGTAHVRHPSWHLTRDDPVWFLLVYFLLCLLHFQPQPLAESSPGP